MSEMLSGYPLLVFSFIFGLLVGSFLNVVAYRLPLQLQGAWRRESLDFLGMESEADAAKINLVFPGSRCPHCEAPIKPWQNIPVLSYLLLKGRCHACSVPISLQYPLLELFSGLLTAAILVIRMGAKELGAWIGTRISRAPKNVKKYLGIALFPQANLVVGLVLIGKEIFPSPMVSNFLINVVIGAVVISQLIGLPLVKYSLEKTGEAITTEENL